MIVDTFVFRQTQTFPSVEQTSANKTKTKNKQTWTNTKQKLKTNWQNKIQKKAGKDSQNTSAMMVATFTGMKYYLGQ